MSQSIKVERMFTIPVHELYGYFADPRLVEKWCAPEGMSLKAHIDFRVGGKYVYEHTNGRGKFICNGHYRKLIQNQMIRMVDDEIIDPTGKLVEKNLGCDITFASLGGGSAIKIVTSGFSSRAAAEECLAGWESCLNQLQDLVKDSGPHQFQEAV